jgi:hypothetical protein
MSFRDKLKHEIQSVLVATLYFAVCFLGMVLVKTLILAEYHIEFSGMLEALIGAAVVGKVVLVLEHVSLGSWVRSHPAWVDVVLRTLLYTMAVFVVLLCEQAFREYRAHDDFGAFVARLFENKNAHHVLAKTLCVGWALLVFNGLTVIRRRLGRAGLLRLFTSPLPAESKAIG